MSKKEFFHRPTPKELRAGPGVEERVTYPYVTAALIERLAPDGHLVADGFWPTRSQPFLAHAPLLRLSADRRVREESDRRLAAWRRRWSPLAGFGWAANGPTRSVPLNDLLEGVALYWYDLHKFPEETSENRQKRLEDEVEIYGFGDPGAYAAVTIPGRSGASYHARIQPLPLDAASWGRMRIDAKHRGFVYHGPGLDADASRIMTTEHEVAALLKLEEQLWRRGERNVSFLPRPSEAFLRFYRAAQRQLLVRLRYGGKTRVARAREADVELAAWGYVRNHADAFRPEKRLFSYDIAR